MNIWKKLFGKKNEGNGSIFPEIKQYPPMPPVVEPEVIGEPASLIIKALQDDSLGWERFDDKRDGFYISGVRSIKKGCDIYTKWSPYSEYLFCPGDSSFTRREKEAVIGALSITLARIRSHAVEKERLATIELFKEYRNV